MWKLKAIAPLLVLLVISLELSNSLPLDQNESLVVSSTTPVSSTSASSTTTTTTTTTTTPSPPPQSTTTILPIPSPKPLEEEAKEVIKKPDTKEDDVPEVPKIYEMRVDSNVTNRFTTTRVTSKVKNLAKKASETTFSVVLPETAYITGFIMEIDGKSYEAYVKEKEEAKQIYNQAVQSGQAAAHIAVSARDSNRFTVSVNVAPQSKAIFKLTYEELLQRRNNQYEIVLNIHPGQPVKDLGVQVNINETRPLKFVKAPPLRSGNEVSKNDETLDPHAEIEQIDPKSAVVKFNPNEEKQKQLAHHLGTKEENGLAGQFLVTYDVERDPQGGEILVKDGYFVHFFAPSELQPLPKQVVFILDTSGSMDGQRIIQLKQAMHSILSELKKEDVFNIVEFNSGVKVWDVENVKVAYDENNDPWAIYNEHTTKASVKQELPPSYEANDANIAKAKQVVQKLNAFGGTDIQAGLQTGLKLVKKHVQANKDSHQPLIIFLTDGEPTVSETSPEKIIANIKELNSGEIKTPIFSLSFGDGADRDFLQKISLKNLGFARHIYEAADASLQLEEFYHQISSPLLSNVNFKYVSNVTKVTKTEFPIFFHGGELVVAGYTDQFQIDPDFVPGTIWGKGPKGPIELKPVVENSVGALERLWAYLTVKQILEDREAADDKTPYTKKALDIALKYAFVTPVTSLVVVKPNETAPINAEDASKISGGYAVDRIYSSNRGPALGISAAGFGGAVPLSGQSPFLFAAPSAPSAPPAPPSAFEEADVDSLIDPAYEARPSFIPAGPPSTYRPQILSTSITSTTTKPNLLESLKSLFPWLSSILDSSGFFTSSTGKHVKLGTDEVLKKTECPKTPVNGTAGTCVLLSQCSQVHSLLKDAQVFLEHSCDVDNIAGICCPETA